MSGKELVKKAIGLCLAVYRVTEKFPEGEVLRDKLREKSLQVIESIIYELSNPAEGSPVNLARPEQNIQDLIACFAVAEQQNWVNKQNFRILEKEYEVLRIETNDRKPSIVRVENEVRRLEINERQKKILRLLKKHNEGVNLEDIAESMGLSKRTVNRELKPLVESGGAIKKGITRGAKFFTVLGHN